MSVTNFAAERGSAIQHARSIIDRAKSASRDLSEAEQAQVEADFAKVHELDRQQKTATETAKSVLSLGNYDQSDEDPDAGQGGGVFSPEAKTGIARALKSRTTFRTEVDAKALLTGGMIPPSGTGVVPGLHPNAFPLSSLFANAPAAGPWVRYYRTTSGTAAVVAEGALKPNAGVQVAAVNLELEKLACLAQVSDEADSDAPYIVAQISNELSAAVAQTENARILNTFDTTSGILTVAGTAATVIDSVADAIAGQEGISGLTPTAIIANPTVVGAIRKAKADSSGTYVVSPTEPGPTQLHGVRVYSTPATPANAVWVVEASGVTIFRRGSLTVDVGTNADDFAHNMRTLRAEERVGTAVMRPSCLTKVTLS